MWLWNSEEINIGISENKTVMDNGKITYSQQKNKKKEMDNPTALQYNGVQEWISGRTHGPSPKLNKRR